MTNAITTLESAPEVRRGDIPLPHRVFTTGSVARICHVAPRTVSKWFDSGRLKGYRIPGSQDRRIPFGDLLEFLQDNAMPIPVEMRPQLRVGVSLSTAERIHAGDGWQHTDDVLEAADWCAGSPIVAAVIGDGIGLTLALRVAQRIRGRHPYAGVTVLVSEGTLIPDALPEGVRVLGRPVAWDDAMGRELEGR